MGRGKGWGRGMGKNGDGTGRDGGWDGDRGPDGWLVHRLRYFQSNGTVHDTVLRVCIAMIQ